MRILKKIFHIHTWSKWKKIAEGNLINPTTKGIQGKYFHQRGVCRSCGLEEQELIKL